MIEGSVSGFGRAQKQMDPTYPDTDSDPDPQHWLVVPFSISLFSSSWMPILPLFSAEPEQPASLDGSDWEVEEGGV